MRENMICSNCGAVLDEENVRTFGSVILCETCFEENTAVCDDLRKTLHLPESKIETDSYIAVQLLESKRFLDFSSIKFMAEQVRGSFSFSILDERNNIYLVKGDSPLSILRFSKLKIIVFASTDEILYRAIAGSALLEELKKGSFEEIKIAQGDILKICASGRVEKDKFTYSEYIGKSWWEYGTSSYKTLLMDDTDYIDDLKTVAKLLRSFTGCHR